MVPFNVISEHIHCCRVHIHGQVDQWREGVLLAGLRMTTTAVVTNMKEVHAFSRMGEVREITTRIRGGTIATMFISPVNAELGHLQGG